MMAHTIMNVGRYIRNYIMWACNGTNYSYGGSHCPLVWIRKRYNRNKNLYAALCEWCDELGPTHCSDYNDPHYHECWKIYKELSNI